MTNHSLELIAHALAEDIGAGDLTSQYFIDVNTIARARLVTREACVLSGVELAAEVFRRTDPSLEIAIQHKDGTRVDSDTTALLIEGAARGILTAERVALNFSQQLSGIATLTRRFVEAVAGSGAVILDTRKTTPGLRMLEKKAVAHGGGTNHRMGLYDAVMIKDNHLPLVGDVASLRSKIAVFKQAHPSITVELEADTIDQVKTFLEIPGVDVILLDNMASDVMRECVSLRSGHAVKLEASGGVTLDRVKEIAATGVDFISIGALTHSAPAADLSLEIELVVGKPF